MRENEAQDVTYHFVSTVEFLKKNIEEFFLEVNFFTVTDEDIWFYGSAEEDYRRRNEETVCILDPNGLKKIREKKIPCTAILIDVDDEDILKRQVERGDNQIEARRRYEADKRDFREIQALVDFVVSNNKDLETVAIEIDILHKNWRRQE
jgi:guanylate kinase